MSDLKLNIEHDLDLTSGRLSLIKSEQELTAQRLKIKFNLYQGEWFLDLSLGVPYFQSILRRGIQSKVIADATFSDIITNDPSIVSLNSFESNVTSSGVYTLKFSATTIDGQIVTFQESIES